jgi:hypothetical protein
MRISPPFWLSLRVVAAAGLVLCFVSACKPSATPTGPTKPVTAKLGTLASSTNHPAMEYVSVFDQLMPPKGKDPFFPNSHRRNPVAPIAGQGQANRPPPASEVVLKGIVGSPNHRLAIINHTTLQVGEVGSVQVPGGHIKVRCMEIGEDYAVVAVEGEIQPKRLELNRKDF